MAKWPGTTRHGPPDLLAKRAVPRWTGVPLPRPGTAREAVSRAGPARWHYDTSKYIVEFSKKCIVVGAQTHNLVHQRLKCIHLTSADAVLLSYMLNSYT